MSTNDPGKGNVPPQMPPTPRDFAKPTVSEMMPFKSTKISIWKSHALIPAVATGLFVVFMYRQVEAENYAGSMAGISTWLLLVVFYAAYLYSGLKTKIWVYLVPFLWCLLALNSPIFSIYGFVFRTLPHADPLGAIQNNDTWGILYGFFFAAGLTEELVKATPTLVGMYLAVRALSKPAGTPATFWDYFKVSSPMEGIMWGLAAGAGFTFSETLFEYVPKYTAQQGVGFGYALLLPRILQSIVGHMGWAAIFGYFIGLAAIYPRSMLKLIGMGYLLAALLHTLWDGGSAVLGGLISEVLAAVLSSLLFVACLIKAKQLLTVSDPNFVPTNSILVSAQPVAASATQDFKMDEVKADAWAGLGHLMNFANTAANAATAAAAQAAAKAQAAAAAQAAANSGAVPQAPAAVAVPPAPSAGAKTFVLACGAARFGIMPGQSIDLAQLFPGQGLPTPCLADVTTNPKDASQIGLKNQSSESWTVTTDTGSVATVGKGRNVKLVPNAKIAVGSAVILVQQV